MMQPRLGALMRFIVDGELRWRLYAGWGSETGAIATCDVTLANWWHLMRQQYGPYRIGPSPAGYRFHDRTTIGRPR